MSLKNSLSALIKKAKLENIAPDKAQLEVIDQLQTIADLLLKESQKPSVNITNNQAINEIKAEGSLFGFFTNKFKKQQEPIQIQQSLNTEMIKGMYIWGEVGRGKTWLMDLFYQTLSLEKIQRIHFHEFMLQVHKQLQDLPKQPDPLDVIGGRMAKKYRLICLDEFHVMDIADAVILHGLLRSLFLNKITIVMTSNRHPDDLYINGSYRERFLPAIELIKKNMHVFHLDSGKDYRKERNQFKGVFLIPHTSENNKEIQEKLETLFVKHAGTENSSNKPIKIYGREIPVIKRTQQVIWFSFDTLCRGARSSTDYLQMAKEYPIIILSKIPILYEGEEGPARRFLNLIDNFYDQKTLLILSSEVMIEEMYQGDLLQFEFQRALSRLHEMNSQSWWEKVTLVNNKSTQKLGQQGGVNA